MRQFLEKTLEYGIGTFHIFIDFKAAYDTINRDKLFEAMKEFKMPQKLMGLARATLKHIKCRVKMQNNLSEPFGTLTGLRQGDALLCILFNLALERLIRDLGIETKGTIYNKTIQILAYTDIVLVGRNIAVLKEPIKNLSKAEKEMGLTINLQKTKYKEGTKKPTTSNLRMLKVDDQEFERVREFNPLWPVGTFKSL
jgi:sorting nexin-29